MFIIKIEQNENGSHANQTFPDGAKLPEGYAKISETLGSAYELPNYPFGNITVEDIDDIPTVTAWEPLPIPEPPVEPEATEETGDTGAETVESET